MTRSMTSTARKGMRFLAGAILLLAAFAAGHCWRAPPAFQSKQGQELATTTRTPRNSPSRPAQTVTQWRGESARGGFRRTAAFAPRSDYNAKWAILIGINQYRDGGGFSELKYAVNDASELKELLVSEFGYQEDHVCLLKNSAATREAVELAFTQWLPHAGPVESDSLLVFFAGHGTRDGREQYDPHRLAAQRQPRAAGPQAVGGGGNLLAEPRQ